MELLARIAPFFLVIAAGALAARAGLLGERPARWLSAYTFWIGFPALLIHWLAHAPPPDPALARSVTIYAAVMAAILSAAPLVGRLAGFPREARAGLALVAGVGNTAFLGAPLAAAVFGEAVRGPAAAFVAVDFILLTAMGVAILQRAAPDRARRLTGVLLNPTVAAAVLGLAVAALGLAIPEPVDRPLGWLAATASPVGLVALGGLIGRERALPRGGEAGPLALGLALKLAAAPLMVWIALGLVDTPAEVRATATLLAACPTAVNVFIQTRSLDVHARGAAQAVALGTAISLASLTLIAGLLAG